MRSPEGELAEAGQVQLLVVVLGPVPDQEVKLPELPRQGLERPIETPSRLLLVGPGP
jgi:hypothetical protein